MTSGYSFAKRPLLWKPRYLNFMCYLNFVTMATTVGCNNFF